jgi:hypothetical protein
MNAAVLLPFQTAFDPPQQAEGSLDPLGLYSIADALGVRLAPGVRERQSKPRYLTLALVGYAICQGMDEVPSARRPPAWLVYEWLVVMALVKQLQGTSQLQGIPGRDKVRDCLGRGEAVCTSNYLKTPSVFGFHGIYRVLGVKTGLFDQDGHPLEAGRRVLQAWQQDRNLFGFFNADGEAGHFRRVIQRTVHASRESGQMQAPGGPLSAWIASHLNPHQIGTIEREALWSALAHSDALRGEYAALLSSQDGQRQWRVADGSEAAYQAWLSDRASLPMQQLLRTIRAFERLARLLVDAFDEARWRMGGESRAVDMAWLAQGTCMQRASKESPAAFNDAVALLGEVDPLARLRLENGFSGLCEPQSSTAFAERLLAHHERVQRSKPPNGKRPWFDTFGDARVAVRPAYVQGAFAEREGHYVHAYRTRPIWNFAVDLGRVAEGAI